MSVDPASNGHRVRQRAPRFPWQIGCGIPVLLAALVVAGIAALMPGWKASARAAEPTARQFLHEIAEGHTDAAYALTSPEYRRNRARHEVEVLEERWAEEFTPAVPVELDFVSVPPLSLGRSAELAFRVRGKERAANVLVYLVRRGDQWLVDGAALRSVQ